MWLPRSTDDVRTPYTSVDVVETITLTRGREMMTPTHQRILDDLLTRTHQRTVALATATNFPMGKRPEAQTIERLRESPLGLHLAAIFNYAEGHDYPYERDVRASVGIISRHLPRAYSGVFPHAVR